MDDGNPPRTVLAPDRYRECLAADAARLRAAAADRPAADVPSCPGWTVTDLLDHVAHVYLHKVAAMRQGRRPVDWPPPATGESAPALYDRALAELTAKFDRRSPTDQTWTFYPDDQTVGFWLRRMAQETVVHRVDAELAAGAVTPVPADLALDGVDEVLRIFLTWGTNAFADEPDTARLLRDCDGRAVRIETGPLRFVVRPTPERIELTGSGPAAARVRADPPEMLLWLWNRGADARVEGEPAPVEQLRRLLADATL